MFQNNFTIMVIIRVDISSYLPLQNWWISRGKHFLYHWSMNIMKFLYLCDYLNTLLIRWPIFIVRPRAQCLNSQHEGLVFEFWVRPPRWLPYGWESNPLFLWVSYAPKSRQPILKSPLRQGQAAKVCRT